MLEEQVVIDSINVTALNTVEVREATQIVKDGIVISKSYHRFVLSPGDDLTNQDNKVKTIAQAAWALI